MFKCPSIEKQKTLQVCSFPSFFGAAEAKERRLVARDCANVLIRMLLHSLAAKRRSNVLGSEKQKTPQKMRVLFCVAEQLTSRQARKKRRSSVAKHAGQGLVRGGPAPSSQRPPTQER
jgi:hypothetical protein